jgi:MerR family mercuric resistance operon transcriptional regulator
MIDRIRFIKRSQNLGFSLDEIRELLRLEQGGNRSAIRKIAGARLANIREKIAALEQMERVLAALLCECEHTATAAPCPIIAALNTDQRAGPQAAPSFPAQGRPDILCTDTLAGSFPTATSTD